MKAFEVYPLYDITVTKGDGMFVFDDKGNKYLDLYGGHAAISIGHAHEHYIHQITEQVKQLSFYSNSVQIPLQAELATKLGKLSEYEFYRLFLCNSGAEAVENALKLASFYNNKKHIVCLKKAFHGRTSAAFSISDSSEVRARINEDMKVTFVDNRDKAALKEAFSEGDVCAFIFEGVQGIAGVYLHEKSFLDLAKELCEKNDAVFICDEVQSGYGRTGKFFAHQHYQLVPDIIAAAKGMGNGFPIGGILIGPKFKASYGMLGTTFGGNNLGCAAGIAVLDVIKSEKLVKNAQMMGDYMLEKLMSIKGKNSSKNSKNIREVRGLGLIIGVEFECEIKELQNALLFKHHIFTGNAYNAHTLRILPPLSIQENHVDYFIDALEQEIS